MPVGPFLATAIVGAIMILAMVANYVSANSGRQRQILLKRET